MNRGACDLEIVTYNVRGLGNFSKRKDVFDFLRGQTADIICLQEVHVAPGKENVFRNQWGGRAWIESVSSTAGGVAILIQNKLACKFIDVVTNAKGSAIFLCLDIYGVKVKIGNVYGNPDCDDPLFFEEVFRLAGSDQQEHLVMCGDWNLTLNAEVDQYNYASRDRRAKSRDMVRSKCLNLSLHDVWRVMNGDRKQFSWRKINPVKCARLDFFLISDSVLSKSLSCEILPAYRSDHSRVTLRLNLSSQVRGRGLWKFNCSLLSDLTFVGVVDGVIQETIQSYACPIYSDEYLKNKEARKDLQLTIKDDLFLETLLMKIRSETISYSAKKNRERTEKEKHMLFQLQELESLSEPTSEDIEDIIHIQSELQALRSYANEGRIIRSRARWYEEGEKGSSSYFLKLEKRNYESKLMPCLDVGDHSVRDSAEILNVLSEHYAELYRTNEACPEAEVIDFLGKVTLPKLSSEDSQTLEKDITVEELGATLLKLSNNRSPGSDGFPYEFFKVFWGEIKHFVHRSICEGLTKGELSITQRQGLITLVPKPSKPRNLISSWRPITLLNSTYKILAAAVANRLKKVLDSIIHPDQTAFLKNRFIGENIRVTYDVLWETYCNQKEGLLLSVDFKTAFDVMNWNFLECCLKKFNFGQKFINIFRSLHKNTFSRLVYNGHLSKRTIKLERGCRQGDPVSCYFFIIGAEVLANRIRQNDNIVGIKIRQATVKMIQYADDTTFFLSGSEKGLRTVFDELGWFAKYSGLRPNVSKCHAMWIGSKAFSSDKLCPEINLTWVNKLKLLGVVFNPQCQDIVDENLKLKRDAILRTIGMWQSRSLSLVGRITIAKSLLLSQITHVISSLPDPSEKLMKEINTILFKFIWNSKRNPLKRIRLCQPLKENGLSMIDLTSYVRSLKMKWIKRLVGGSRSSWRELAPSRIQNDFIWNFGIVALKKALGEISNPFWRDVVAAWIYFSKIFVIRDDLICNENIFNSDYTKFKSTRYSSWERKGVRTIGDLFEGNKLITWQRFRLLYSIPCNFLEYQGLLHSLPRALQRDQRSGWYLHRPSISARLLSLLSNRSFTKIFSVAQVGSNARSQKDIARIREKWTRDINDFEPMSVQIVKDSISATRYLSFQFRLVMRIVTTNTFLRLIGCREDDQCTFCDKVPETLPHLFLFCPFVQNYWNAILQYLTAKGLQQICIKTKIWGQRDNALITHVVTLAKYVIYESRGKEVRPSFKHFMSCLKRDFETERFIASNQNDTERFSKKWSPVAADLSTRS